MEQSDFAAAVVTYGILDDSVDAHVGWGERHDGKGRHLIVMRAHDDSHYCVVAGDEDAHATHYGGILSAQVEPTETVLTLDSQAAIALRLSSVVRISYNADAVDTGALRRHLTSVLAGAARK